jgi:hypothetical protein
MPLSGGEVAPRTRGAAVFARGHQSNVNCDEPLSGSRPVMIPWRAQAAAAAKGGSLATITSPEENAFVFDLVDDDPAFWDDSSPVNNHGIGPWLGGLQPPGSIGPGGGWDWVTNEPWSYTNWGSGQPNEAGELTQDRLQFIGINTLIGPYWNDLSGDHVT